MLTKEQRIDKARRDIDVEFEKAWKHYKHLFPNKSPGTQVATHKIWEYGVRVGALIAGHELIERAAIESYEVVKGYFESGGKSMLTKDQVIEAIRAERKAK